MSLSLLVAVSTDIFLGCRREGLLVAKGSSQKEAIPYEELLYFTYKTHLETQSLLRHPDPPPPASRLPIIILKAFQKQWNSDWKKITFTQRAQLFYKKMLF